MLYHLDSKNIYAAVSELTETEKNRLVCLYLNTEGQVSMKSRTKLNPLIILILSKTNWAKATEEFGSASIESMKKCTMNTIKKLNDKIAKTSDGAESTDAADAADDADATDMTTEKTKTTKRKTRGSAGEKKPAKPRTPRKKAKITEETPSLGRISQYFRR
jgi:hypothetical protein